MTKLLEITHEANPRNTGRPSEHDHILAST